MQISTFETILYTAVALLPGFIISSIVDAINPPSKQPEYKYFLKCLFYSIFSCGCWSWLLVAIISCEKLTPFGHWILLVLATIVGSIVLGFILAIIKQRSSVRKIASVLKINTIHAIPTAWDYFFSKQESCFIIVTLTDGTELRGWYNGNSFSSSDPEERDLYIEQAYDDNWNLVEENIGFYISKDQIKYIEFKRGAINNEQK